MKCPVCGNEMEQGFLQGNQRVAWVKNKHNVSILPKEGEVLLKNKAFGSFLFPAWICKECNRFYSITPAKIYRRVKVVLTFLDEMYWKRCN